MNSKTKYLLIGAALMGAGLTATRGHATNSTQCVATDGDTLICGGKTHRVRIRLNGIDAPELPGHCPASRVCAPGDPLASKRNLAALIAGKVVTWRSLGKDKYGRTLALPKADGLDLSCEQLRGGYAIYRKDWDKGRRLGRACPLNG